MNPAATLVRGDEEKEPGGEKEEGQGSLLARWFAAPNGVEADRLLTRVLTEEGWPVIQAIVRRKFGPRHGEPDADDIVSEARLQVVRTLQRLRAGPTGQEKTSGFDLPAYAATITYTAWADHLRRRHPARAMLLNRLRYLLENRAGPHGFALWRGASGERLAGFAAWQSAGTTAAPTPRCRWLLADPLAAAADAFGADRVPDDLAALVAGLLNWVGGPVELRDLQHALTELRGLGEPPAPPAAEEDAAPDPGPSPLEALHWKEYLGWLWRKVLELPLRQRTAFLCHSSLLREMELCGLVSIRTAATALEIAPERMAGIWSQLPLPDLDIAALLGDRSRQQVINLRKVARTTLGRAWQQAQDEVFLINPPAPGISPRIPR